MMRLGALFWILLVLASGFATFKVKYAVQGLVDQLSAVRQQTLSEQQQIRVLTAEWTYLNQPERLADLNRRFLGLTPIATRQLQTRIADLPLRAPAPPADIVVAAQPVPPAPAPAVLVAAKAAPPRVRLAKADSLDALIALIAEKR